VFEVRTVLARQGVRVGSMEYSLALDINLDGVIDAVEARAVLAAFGQPCP
jgi:hypothetical protein